MDIIIVKGIALSRPIARTTKAFELFDDNAAMLILPVQYSPHKLFTPKIMASLFLSSPQMFFHDGLRADTGVIGAWQPEHLEAEHAGATRENILDCVIQHMTKR